MLRKAILLLTPLTILATAIGYGQQDEPAEKVFKNIKSFQGKPARDILPTMRFMSASLKVHCNFCHDTRNFSADTKEQKRTAREMIAMMNGINKAYFDGNAQVNCNSCHNGHSRPTRQPLVAGLTARHPDAKTDIAPEDIIKKFTAAVGGDFKSLELKGTETEDKDSSPYDLIQAGTNMFLLKSDNVLSGYDGTHAWHSVDGHTRTLWGDNAVEVARIGRSFRTAASFSRYGTLVLMGRDTVDGKTCLVLRGAIAADKVSEELYFEERTGLLLRVATFTQSEFGAVPSYVDYDNYRRVNGVLVPFKVTSTSDVGDVSVLQIKSAKANVPVNDAMFSPPANK